jgi:UPF0042 nucleotide-binding protein
LKFRFISYGFKYYEAVGEKAPVHDFLFNLRDLDNPFWIEELRPLHGLEEGIIDFFNKNPDIQQRVSKIEDLIKDFIEDALRNSSRSDVEDITFAFRCTGGKHRSVYFAQSIFTNIQNTFKDRELSLETGKKIDFEVEHIDLPRYQGIKSI